MLAHNIKEILLLVPEATSMVKQASLEEEFPTDSKDSTCASYLRIEYLEKVAGRRVSLDTVHKVRQAAELYGVDEKLQEYKGRFKTREKRASAPGNEFGLSIREIEAGFEGDLAGLGFLGIEKAASAAKNIVQEYGKLVKSAEVLRYAGVAYLDKEAAVKTLANRYFATKDTSFVKVARLVVDEIRENDTAAIGALCDTVTKLDKQAGLDIIGFNFYKEALLTKKAALASAMMVNLAGTQTPWESIQKFGKDRIASTLGADIAKGLTGDPVNDKAVLESLPRDLQVMLGSLVKGI